MRRHPIAFAVFAVILITAGCATAAPVLISEVKGRKGAQPLWKKKECKEVEARIIMPGKKKMGRAKVCVVESRYRGNVQVFIREKETEEITETTMPIVEAKK